MHGAVLFATGEVPRYADFPEPHGEVPGAIVEVHAAGLNPSDRGWADGRIPNDFPLPRVVGNEGVGLVDGQRVYFERSIPPYGSFAARAVTNGADVILLDDGIDDFSALTIGIAGLSAWVSMETAAGLQPGESVLVLGASGSLGRVAVQGARLMGASRVVAAARHRPSLDELLASPGAADAIIELGSDDDGAAIRDAAGPGFDVVVDTLFGDYLVAALAATVYKGRLVTVGRNASGEATVPMELLSGRSILAYTNFWYPPAVKRKAYQKMMAHVIAGELVLPYRVEALKDVTAVWAESITTSPHRKLVFTP